MARVYLSETRDPWLNLALEDWLFRQMDPEEPILFLWRNRSAVVLGRFQNPWLECHTANMERDGVALVRRQSGGGTVYHDPGNTNFSFLTSRKSFDKKRHNHILTSALNRFNVHCYPSGRNDILIKDPSDVTSDKKISGSAFKEKRDRSFHHGTLLIDADLEKLWRYLLPAQKAMRGKGISSVRSPVANLKDFDQGISHQSFCENLIHEFFSYYQAQGDIQTLDAKALLEIPSIKKYYEELKSWKWRFGETPAFQLELQNSFEWGEMNLSFRVKKGIVEELKIHSNDLHPEMLEVLENCFTGQIYHSEGIWRALQIATKELDFLKEELHQLAHWIEEQIR